MGGQPYQEQYVKNAEEIGRLWQFTASPGVCFEDWYAKRLRDRARLAELKQENAALLSNCLYPALDALYEADEETLRALPRLRTLQNGRGAAGKHPPRLRSRKPPDPPAHPLRVR